MRQEMQRPAVPRLAFPALILANLFLAAGPWLVRLARADPQDKDKGGKAANASRAMLALKLSLRAP